MPSEADCKTQSIVAVTNLARQNFGAVKLESIKRTNIRQLTASIKQYTFQVYMNGQDLGYNIQGETYSKDIGCYITKIEMLRFDPNQ